jgi:hypothetical protein
MRILIKFPTRERPEKFYKAIENIKDNIRTKDFGILVSLDLDDKSMKTPGMKSFIDSHKEIKAVWGTSNGKVDAINRDIWLMDRYKWKILLVHSDDMWFTKKHFDDDIIEAFDKFYGLVHFPDQRAGEKLITYPMMHREYYDRFGYVYNPEYSSVYCDNEQHDVAVMLSKYKFVDKKILEHRHPIWGFGKNDALYLRNEEPTQYATDKATYHKRKAENFEI